MFTIRRTQYGVTYPLAAIYINDASSEHIENDVSVQAFGHAELDVFGVGCSTKFVEDGTLTEFAFPLQASDFATERDGSLSFTLTDSYADGLYSASLVVKKAIFGIFGGGPFVSVQGANETTVMARLATFLHIQAVTDDYEEEARLVRRVVPYTVKVVTRG